MPRVTKDQRALLVANYLALPSENRAFWQWLYGYLEGAGVRIARLWLDNHYRTIRVMQGAAVTRAGLVSELRSLTSATGIRAVDLFLQVHGDPGSLTFRDGSVSVNALRDDIKASVDGDSLRLLYNLACYGDTHSDALLEAGFVTSVGSIGINASAGVEYPTFCRLWRKGRSVENVMRNADRSVTRRPQDAVAGRLLGDDRVNSRKVIRGQEDLTIDTSPPRTATADTGPQRVTLMDETRVHQRLRGSRQRMVINDRLMDGGCTVRAVNLVRVNSRDEIIEGPSREITIGNLRRAGVTVTEDAVGTNSLRARILSWNGTTQNLYYRVVYTVDQAPGANCSL